MAAIVHGPATVRKPKGEPGGFVPLGPASRITLDQLPEPALWAVGGKAAHVLVRLPSGSHAALNNRPGQDVGRGSADRGERPMDSTAHPDRRALLAGGLAVA